MKGLEPKATSQRLRLLTRYRMNNIVMDSQLLSTNSEAAIAESDRERMLELAERSEAGTLTADEEREFDGYLHVGNLLTVMQSRARRALGEQPPGSLNS